MKTTEDTIESLEEITERFGADAEVEIEAEDLEGWPIKPWELEDTPEDEISKKLIKIRMWFEDEQSNQIGATIKNITAAAKNELGIELHTESESRKWRPGASGAQQINLSTEKP